jgi:hypothetical protein
VNSWIAALFITTTGEHNLEWEPNERDAWVADAERWIGQIKGVLQSKIDLDTDGAVTGIHVVSGMDREPRHIVRDVESLLKARLDIEVYYKKIGVVQVLDNDTETAPLPEPTKTEIPAAQAPQSQTNAEAVSFHPPIGDVTGSDSPSEIPSFEETAASAEPAVLNNATPAILVSEEMAPRVQCNDVGVMATEMVVRVEVLLKAGGMEARGTCEGPNHSGSDGLLVARAALDALMELMADKVLLHLHELRFETLGSKDVVLCAVDLVEGRRSETLFGACSSEHNRQQAVVYAILDALNRRLSILSFKSEAEEG